jgi:phosphoribosyl 1,2-cyclic phosphodiesterase
MSLRFCVLGSGSSGNASYLEADGFGVLLDIGLGPRRLARGLADAGARWDDVRAVLLTHTHGDHWHEATFKHLLRRRIPFHCHEQHAGVLKRYGAAFAELRDAGLVRIYEIDQPVPLGPLSGLPFAVPHDDEPTCGFRIHGSAGALGYVADLGSWSEAIVRQLCDVDILAVEFNHDVHLERGSGRTPMLIDRVLGNLGHLSNDQGAELVAQVLRRSEPGRTRHLMLLHLSRQCNHPRLARAAAAEVVARHATGLTIHVSRHNTASRVLSTGRRPGSRRRFSEIVQPMLPGWDDAAP